jgi:hypothetical protein
MCRAGLPGRAGQGVHRAGRAGRAAASAATTRACWWRCARSAMSTPRRWDRPSTATASARSTPSTGSGTYSAPVKSASPTGNATGWPQLHRRRTPRRSPSAYYCAQLVLSFYHQTSHAAGRRAAIQVLDALPGCPFPGIARFGRTLRQWCRELLGYFDTGGVNNGGTESVDGLIGLHRRIARGFPRPRHLPTTHAPDRGRTHPPHLGIGGSGFRLTANWLTCLGCNISHMSRIPLMQGTAVRLASLSAAATVQAKAAGALFLEPHPTATHGYVESDL